MNPITTNIKSCARCGGDHDGLTFAPLSVPVDGDPPMTHWALCPHSGEPILLYAKAATGGGEG